MQDNNRTLTSIIIAVLVLTLSHGSDGGSWKNLERKFIQDHHFSRHWDEKRIHFPGEDYREPSWRPDNNLPQDEYARLQCLTSCRAPRDSRPVCGTDGITYQNMERLRCAMGCGIDAELNHHGACVIESPPPATTTTLSTTLAPFTSTTRSLEMESCIRSCPSTPEYNPVCGTNFVTYNNIGKLECDKYCGVVVQFWRHSRCPIVTSTTSAPTTTTRSDYEIQYCIDSCPVTSQYDPVCGTNEVTYENIGKLECAKACGVDVNFKRQLPCSVAVISTEGPDYGSSETSSSEEDYGGDIDIRYPGPISRRRFFNKK